MARTSNPWQTPKVIFNPAAYRGMQRGINQLADAIRPTLGPLPRLVIDKHFGADLPEAIDSGALIARRIIQLRDRQADVGAMYLRNLLWRLYETAGDGTATAAVLFQAIYNHGVRYVVAGGDAMRLRRHLEAGAQLIMDLLAGRTLQIAGQAQLAGLAETICSDQELSVALGEVFGLNGPCGRLGPGPRDPPQGGRQDRGGNLLDRAPFSPPMITRPNRRRALLEQPAILLSNIEVSEPNQLIPAM